MGLEFSLNDFLENELVDGQICDGLLQPRVLRLKLPHPVGLVDPQTAVALAPPEVGLVGHPELLAGLSHRLALTAHYIRLAQLLDDLLGRKSLFRRIPSLHVPSF